MARGEGVEVSAHTVSKLINVHDKPQLCGADTTDSASNLIVVIDISSAGYAKGYGHSRWEMLIFAMTWYIVIVVTWLRLNVCP